MDVELVRYGQNKSFTCRMIANGDIVAGVMDIDETDVVVGLSGVKTVDATATFDGEENVDRLCLFDMLDLLSDLLGDGVDWCSAGGFCVAVHCVWTRLG